MSGITGKISGDTTVGYKPGLFIPAVDMTLPVGGQNVKLLGSSLLPASSVFTPQQYGAVGDGVADDTAALQATINAVAGAGGGVVQLGVANYKITGTLTIGNGTSSSVSSIPGVVLRGAMPPTAPWLWAGFTVQPATRITWAGAAVPIISVRGPLQGWGVQNIALIGSNLATTGIEVISGQFGDTSNVAITGCVTNGISTTTVARPAGAGSSGSIYNAWRNISITCPTVANVRGILLTGYGPTVTDNTAFSSFDNILIACPASGNSVAIYLQNADSNTFSNVLLASGSSTSTGVQFDYTANTGAVFPGANSFFGIDSNGTTLGANQFVNAGTPSASARPNYVRGLNQANGAANPQLANMRPDLPVDTTPGVLLVSQNASIGATAIGVPFAFGIYRISLYLAIQGTGNAVNLTAALSWNDGSPRTMQTAAINMSTGANNPQSISQTVINVANLGFGYSTTVSGAIGAGSYMLGIAVERLS